MGASPASASATASFAAGASGGAADGCRVGAGDTFSASEGRGAEAAQSVSGTDASDRGTVDMRGTSLPACPSPGTGGTESRMADAPFASLPCCRVFFLFLHVVVCAWVMYNVRT